MVKRPLRIGTGSVLLLVLLGLVFGIRMLNGPDTATIASHWVPSGPVQLRVDRVSTFTLAQYRSYRRPPDWLLRLADRIPWLSYVKPPLNGVEPPPYRHETVIVEASVQGNPLPQAQDLAFFLEVEDETLDNNGHAWVEEPGTVLRLQSEFYIPEGTRPSAVIISLNGQPHRFPITYR